MMIVTQSNIECIHARIERLESLRMSCTWERLERIDEELIRLKEQRKTTGFVPLF